MQLKYEKTIVEGLTDDGNLVREEIVHHENQDPLLMAMRRNRRMQDCKTVKTVTVEAFRRYVDVEPHAGRRDIPVMGRGYIEYEW